MSFLLRYTNPYGERFHFCNLGDQWLSRPACRLIDLTMRNPAAKEVRVFATPEDAQAILVIAGSPAKITENNPVGWEIIPTP